MRGLTRCLTCWLFSAAVLAPVIACAAAIPAPLAPPTKVATVEGITEYRLGNGMRVLLFPDPSKPTLTTNIVYLVGSRHEHYGETGMAHLLEHLLFKPTANFGIRKGTRTPVEILNASGADFNGTTSYDRTNYYATFPANEDNLRLMLALEADRMVNSPIDQNDLWNTRTGKGEMTVVRNEFEMGESDPLAVTVERLQAVAYDWHNYGKSTIGARSDIEQVDIASLRAFYKRYYQPDNAMLMVAGRFDEARVLGQVNVLFGRIARPARVLRPTYTREPVQDGERAVTVRRSGGTQYVGAGYHVPPSSHEDGAALALLERILVDAPGGRLHKALVEAKLAASVDAEGSSSLEPGYRIFGALVPTTLSLDGAEAAMLKVLENFKTAPVTEAEVARAKQAAIKQMELAASDTAALTLELTESMAAGDWRLFFVRRDRIEKATAAQVQAAAEKYLTPSNRTLGRFIPTDAPQRSVVPEAGDVKALVQGYRGRAAIAQGEAFDAGPANIEARTERVTLANGMRGALLPKKTKGAMAALTLRLQTGSADTLKGRAEAGTFAAALLTRGTQRLSRQEIKDAFDKLRTSVAIGGGPDGVTVSLLGGRENLPGALALVAELLKTPAYPEAQFAELQREQVNAVAQQVPEPDAMAGNAMSRLIDATPEGHVQHVLTLPGKLAALQALTVDQVRAFHKDFYGANNGVFAAVGDFDAAALKLQMAALFGSWNAAQPYVRMPATIAGVAGRTIVLEAPDKENSMLLMLQPMLLKDDDPAYPALLMANHMLGGGALHSRLADRIRQKEGWSYGVGSQLNVPEREPAGMWLAYAISAPGNTAKVEAALREEIARALTDGFTADELAEAKKGWRQAEQVARTDDGALAQRLAGYLAMQRTFVYERELEAKVAALSVAQVNEALRLYLKPGSLSVISAGDFAKAKK